ncbi:MAG: hypothetical protein JW751_29405 [Polyangiaceae bacterium]|nr:hypothetical protein [Polyangiaceae bacterium]
MKPRRAGGFWNGITVLGDGAVQVVNPDGTEIRDWGEFEACDPELACTYGRVHAAPDTPGQVVIDGVLVDHAGREIAKDREYNAVTLLGVESEESYVTHLIVVDAIDDAIELFGGSIPLDRIWCVDAGDEALDLDEGYHGRVSNLVAEYRSAFHSKTGWGAEVVEVTGPSGSNSAAGEGRSVIGKMCLLPREEVPPSTAFKFHFRPEADHERFGRETPHLELEELQVFGEGRILRYGPAVVVFGSTVAERHHLQLALGRP